MEFALVPVVPGSQFNLQRFAEEPPAEPKALEGGKDKGDPAPSDPPQNGDDDPLDLDEGIEGEDEGKEDELEDEERAELERLRGEFLTPEEKLKRELERERKKRERAEAQAGKLRQQELRRVIAAKFKVPERVVLGATKAEMIRSAKDWSDTAAALRGDIEKELRAEFEGRLGKVITPEKPKTPEGAPADDLEKQIKEASEKGDVDLVTRLVTQKLIRAKSKAAQ